MALTLGTVPALAVTYGKLTYTVSNGEVTITDCKETATEVTIPDTIEGYPVTTIGKCAFESCRSLSSVTIPDSVTTIGESAFNGCDKLISVTLGSSVTEIGKDAFGNCHALSDIRFPKSLKTIGEGAFGYCVALCEVRLPEGLTAIGTGAFFSCNGMTELSVPKSVTSIGESAFQYCDKLETVYYGGTEEDWNNIVIDSENEYLLNAEIVFADEEVFSYEIKDGEVTITGCAETATEVTIPDTIEGYPVTKIGEKAFSNCRNLTSITISKNIIEIGNFAFQYCAGLTEVNIEDLAAWCEIDFLGYTANPVVYSQKLYINGNLVTQLVIPDGVTEIGNYAFTECIDIIGITIPDGVTIIGKYAFSGCDSLTKVIGGDDVTSIGECAFCDCVNLTSIDISENTETIGNGAFIDCSGLISVTIPDSVTSIGYSAFHGCTKLTTVHYAGTESEWNAITIGSYNDALLNAEIVFGEKEPPYRINSITIKNSAGEEITEIPNGSFLATVSFTNVTATEDSVIILAQYTKEGAFRNVIYVQTEDIPQGSTVKYTVPIDNKAGDIATLKAFCWESFASMTPVGDMAIYPANEQ